MCGVGFVLFTEHFQMEEIEIGGGCITGGTDEKCSLYIAVILTPIRLGDLTAGGRARTYSVSQPGIRVWCLRIPRVV